MCSLLPIKFNVKFLVSEKGMTDMEMMTMIVMTVSLLYLFGVLIMAARSFSDFLESFPIEIALPNFQPAKCHSRISFFSEKQLSANTAQQRNYLKLKCYIVTL